MNERVAWIVGSGGVLGTALQREFAAAGYRIVGLQRNVAASVEAAVAPSRLVPCNLEDPELTRATLDRLLNEYARADVLVLNATHLIVAPFLDVPLASLNTAWAVSVQSAIVAAQAVVPVMLRRGAGTILFTGATAALRGSSQFAALAMTKFALRGLAQSLAREYQSQGIHVVHVILDGLLRGSRSIERFRGEDAKSLDPASVAKTYRWLVDQPRDAWTHELELRPYQESF